MCRAASAGCENERSGVGHENLFFFFFSQKEFPADYLLHRSGYQVLLITPLYVMVEVYADYTLIRARV